MPVGGGFLLSMLDALERGGTSEVIGIIEAERDAGSTQPELYAAVSTVAAACHPDDPRTVSVRRVASLTSAC